MSAAQQYANKTQSKLKFDSMIHAGTAVTFSAFLTSFTQTFSSQWNEEVVYGRNDPIGNFQGTQRKLSLAWDIPAANIDEARENLEKVSKLVQMLYPAYSSPRLDTTDKAGQTQTVGSNAFNLIQVADDSAYVCQFNCGFKRKNRRRWVIGIYQQSQLESGFGNGNVYHREVTLSLRLLL